MREFDYRVKELGERRVEPSVLYSHILFMDEIAGQARNDKSRVRNDIIIDSQADTSPLLIMTVVESVMTDKTLIISTTRTGLKGVATPCRKSSKSYYSLL